MEFIIEKQDLLKELQVVTGVVEKRATLPILANLLIETHDGGLQVGASDLEVTIQGRTKASVVKPGSVTLPAGKLHDIARSLPDSSVKFKLLENHQVAITCERTRYRIAGQARDEFPKFPEIDASKGFRLPARGLNRMIERAAFAITNEDPRYSLNGALVKLSDGRLTMVATDGHRLSFVSKKVELKDPAAELELIVPRKALAEVAKMTADLASDEEIVFGRTDNHVFFVIGEHRLTSNVLDGSFPRYENVMPKACGTTLNVPTIDLSHAVRRVSLLASDRYGRAVRLGLTKGKLELFSKTELGEAQEELAVDYDGEDVSIGFNARYLLDFLGVVGSPSVRLELNPQKEGETAGAEASDKPGQLRPEPEEDLSYRYVVMPMHL